MIVLYIYLIMKLKKYPPEISKPSPPFPSLLPVSHCNAGWVSNLDGNHEQEIYLGSNKGCLNPSNHIMQTLWTPVMGSNQGRGPTFATMKLFDKTWKYIWLWYNFSTLRGCSWFNTLSVKQNGRQFADDIFKYIFLNENVWISINISLKFFFYFYFF